MPLVLFYLVKHWHRFDGFGALLLFPLAALRLREFLATRVENYPDYTNLPTFLTLELPQAL